MSKIPDRGGKPVELEFLVNKNERRATVQTQETAIIPAIGDIVNVYDDDDDRLCNYLKVEKRTFIYDMSKRLVKVTLECCDLASGNKRRCASNLQTKPVT
jgi:hypothetical protein